MTNRERKEERDRGSEQGRVARKGGKEARKRGAGE